MATGIFGPVRIVLQAVMVLSMLLLMNKADALLRQLCMIKKYMLKDI